LQRYWHCLLLLAARLKLQLQLLHQHLLLKLLKKLLLLQMQLKMLLLLRLLLKLQKTLLLLPTHRRSNIAFPKKAAHRAAFFIDFMLYLYSLPHQINLLS
jgi:hypothetical protein